MADYFTKFCVEVPNLTGDELSWMNTALEEIGKLGVEGAERPAELLGLTAVADQMWDGEDYSWGILHAAHHDHEGSTFTFFDEEQPNIDALLELMKVFLARFRPSAVFTLEWSYDCSRARTDAYGGGVGWATATATGAVGTADLVMRVIKLVNAGELDKLKELLP